MAQKEQVIKDLDKIISLIRTDSDQISADDKKKWWMTHFTILTTM